MTQTTDTTVSVAALYQFARFAEHGLDHRDLRAPLMTLAQDNGIRGSLLLAAEGINGTIAGLREGLDAMLAHIRALPGCGGVDVKFSTAPAMPFDRMKVRLKQEIVTMGQPDLDPLRDVGTYVAPQDWNALIADPGTILIDTRNDYEVAVGTFAGAIDPRTRSFREFPEWFRAQRDDLLGTGTPPRVAMFCTGGIRCEKSTAFLKAEGIEEVYHLKGGILKYLEEIAPEDSLWQGECYVFDHRVTVGHGLVPGDYTACAGCGRPVGAAHKADPLYEEGVCCPACHDERTPEQHATARARHAQQLHQAQAAARAAKVADARARNAAKQAAQKG
ncbi:rhodanese-related sulfurtransferase [Novosphingobium sp. FSY-8]|uniref:tRNA uridine(34) hydroxylase n=1 Tax=Novosphingobium ovatum TaxID=1908523 RepID=A0ABW9XDM7_9SPHN|nr:rhodanese-related sulfurtransferase [Novosphingobium ovatum]NBC36623.1 rhodanese-related sulfurtransferase [Novosphingobium ovatum]